MVVPAGQPASTLSTTMPPSKVMEQPSPSVSRRVRASIRETEAMAAKASPRKPRVPMASRSYSVLIFEVA